MQQKLIGRTEEVKVLKEALQSNKAEMIAVIGRRRVGKTFLIKSTYGDQIDFEITGIQHATRSEQLQNFALRLSKFSSSNQFFSTPKNWLEAFHILTNLLETKEKDGKLTVFLDELPWLATHKSGFLKGLSYFWNSWAVNQNIVVVICGSAASWMIKKVVHHKGGLHNRITRQIHLKPFNLAETEYYLKSKNLRFDRYQILHLYMAMGGVPHYLEAIEKGRSAAQNINQICFSDTGLLRDEFQKLYPSLFENAELHTQIVRALAEKRKGLTRGEIVETAKITAGGGTTKALEELEYSGFISKYFPFGKKKKESLYRLTDEYSLFYLRFIENNRYQGKDTWQQLSKTQGYISWAGYTFESICLKHLEQIKKALGISGVYALASTFVKKGTESEQGFQIDLLIDRNDHVINFCEMKFYAAEFTLTKVIALDYRNKIVAFKEATNTKKQVFLTLITTFGLSENIYSMDLVDTQLTMEDLFEAS